MAEKSEYVPNVYPGKDEISERRRRLWDKNRSLLKYRNIAEDDITELLSHRSVRSAYVSVHPPLEEIIEPYDPIKHIVVPTAGARAGDRIRFIQFSDSFHKPPIAPFGRARLYLARFRGVDTVVYSGRELLEMRERDLEKATKTLLETEVFNPALDALKGITVHGHSLRLDEDGLMFDSRRRYIYDRETGQVVYIKDQMGNVLDNPIPLGPPMPEDEVKKLCITYSWDTQPYKARTELFEVMTRAAKLRVMGGFNPELINEKM